jgi:hypothetical protein
MREQLEAAEAHHAAGVRADVPPVPPWIQVTAPARTARQVASQSPPQAVVMSGSRHVVHQHTRPHGMTAQREM